jgi:hypothetical protein
MELNPTKLEGITQIGRGLHKSIAESRLRAFT